MMMAWGKTLRTLQEQAVRLVTCEALLVETRARETYWRVRCDKLADQLLAKAGAITHPVFEERPPADPLTKGISRLFDGLGATMMPRTPSNGPDTLG